MACVMRSIREFEGDKPEMIPLPSQRGPMTNRMQVVFENLGLYALWIILAALAAYTAFQLHAMSIYLGILIVENPALRPTGWTIGTINALSRLVWLVLGILWLGFVIFSEKHLGDGQKRQLLRAYAIRLFIIIGAIYGLSYLVLILF